MSKNMRVYQLARELDVESKEILRILQEDMKIDVSNHMSTINNQVAARVRRIMAGPKDRGVKGPVPAAPQAAVPATPPPAAGELPKKAKPAALPLKSRKPEKPVAEKIAVEAEDNNQSRFEEYEEYETDDSLRRPLRPRKHQSREITLTGPVKVGDLADKLGMKHRDAVQELVNMGVMAGANQELDLKTATRFAGEMGASVNIEEAPAPEPLWEELGPQTQADPARLRPRWPVVTVLGHVDHGKTTLLDAIRKTNVTSQEAGGITQHIGASVVEVEGKKIVFLDTPGHEAFTAMRARGASVTDIAVLVVAADDGVMPQTEEAINHARDAGVPIIVAINKIDRANAQPDVVKQQLSDRGLVPEEWGGETVMVPVSALQKEGISELLDMILLVAEMEELQADPEVEAGGVVIEARLDKGRGPVATVLIQSGTLRRGDAFVAGACYGRVRAMLDFRGENLNEAGPATPVEILGLADVPNAGDLLQVVADEKTARNVAAERQKTVRDHELASSRSVTLDDFYRRMQAGSAKELKLILKGDVQGTVEALRGILEKFSHEEVGINIVHAGVGAITESDVMFASASGAIIIGFNVRPNSGALRTAEEEKIEIRTYRVIYEILDDIKAALEGMLEPEQREVVTGRAEVRATFRVPDLGAVAGLYVNDGKIVRNGRVRVLRDGVVVHEGRIASLKRFQDDVREVAQGYECGLGIEKFNDIKEGDELEVFVTEKVKRALT